MDRTGQLDYVTYRLRTRRARERRSGSETWIDHLCLFHDDQSISATWQPDTGVYHCWAEDRTYSLAEVMSALGPGERGAQTTGARSLIHALKPRLSHGDAMTQDSESAPPPQVSGRLAYRYTYPDGRTSHIHHRVEYDDGSKQMPFSDAQGTFGRPKEYWPIYDEAALEPGLILLVVEGEKCVDLVNAVHDEYQEIAIRALTLGATADFKAHAAELAERLQELAPSCLLLWPDNDPPGLDAMRALRTHLVRLHIPHAMVDPMRYGLGLKEDVADYLYNSGSLSLVVADHWAATVKTSNGNGQATQRMKDLIDATVMLSPDQMVYMSTQTPTKVDVPHIEAIWMENFSALPPAQVAREMRARLISKGINHPVRASFRLHTSANGFWWRPRHDQPCYLVTREDITRVENPPDCLLLAPRSSPRFSTEVDLEGTEQDFDALVNAFKVSSVERALIQTWLICALLGRRTPILLFKGDAATGKTTLASHLCALVDPDVPFLTAQQIERDVREFIRTAQRHPALLLDNVSQVSSLAEDALSKLVTGDSASLRVLYEDVTETVHLQRAVIVTTTTWDIAKGDLATRIWPLEPQPLSEFISEEEIEARFGALMPRIRGYLFKLARKVMEAERTLPFATSRLRVGGRVMQCLGYDSERIAARISQARARVIAQGEPWLDALVDLWGEIEAAGPYNFTPTELAVILRRATGDEPTPKALAGFIRPRQALFPNYGFSITWGRTTQTRYYKFEAVDMPRLPDGDD